MNLAAALKCSKNYQNCPKLTSKVLLKGETNTFRAKTDFPFKISLVQQALLKTNNLQFFFGAPMLQI